MFVSNLIAASTNFIARLPGGRLGTFGLLFCPAFFLAIALVQKNPLARFADSPVLISDIDLTLAKALPRNFRTTDDAPKTTEGISIS